MASRYPRLGVARDPALERALRQTKPLLSDQETRSAAAQVRALALRGASSVLSRGGPAAELRGRLVEKHGAIPARVDPRTIPGPDEELDPTDPTPATDALRWVRGE